jgi:hypothetical protein
MTYDEKCNKKDTDYSAGMGEKATCAHWKVPLPCFMEMESEPSLKGLWVFNRQRWQGDRRKNMSKDPEIMKIYLVIT